MTPADQKRFSTLQALAAIALIQLVKVEGDNGRPQFYAHKWAMTKHFDDLSDVAGWLEQVTGKKVA